MSKDDYGRALIFGLCLAAAGCATLRTDPEPAPTPPPSRPEPPPRPARLEGPINIAASVDWATQHAPSLRAARARADSAGAGVDLADTAYLPRLDFIWQEIRATRNNISGTTLPNGVIPGISGPVNRSKSWDSGWGSNAGAMLSYEPIDFGLRSANVEAARRSARQADADIQVTKLDAAGETAEAFLTHLAAQQTQRTAQANLQRWEVFAKAIHALADKDLRPGAEASRADAEVAAARNQLLLSEQTAQTARLALAEAMGSDDASLATDPGPLLDLPPQARLSSDPSAHPLLARQSAAADSAQARMDALDYAYAPKISLQLAANARGSGFDAAGSLDADDGLYPTRPNWAAGLSLTFSALDTYSIRARQRGEEGAARAERARADEIYLRLKMQNARIQVVHETARKIAANTPVQLKAAQDAYAQARARYDAGLGTLTEVSEAQRLLAQAEIDDALARLAVWRTLAAASRIQGDLQPFLQLVASAKEGKR